MSDQPLTEEKIEEHRAKFAKKRADAMKARAKADYAPKTAAVRIDPKESA